MPSFDFTSEADMVAMKNAIDVASRQIDNRYDFKGTSAAVEFNKKDKQVIIFGDSDFQIDQVRDVLGRMSAADKRDFGSVKTRIRETVSAFLYRKTKRSPMILPILMEV